MEPVVKVLTKERARKASTVEQIDRTKPSAIMATTAVFKRKAELATSAPANRSRMARGLLSYGHGRAR